MAKRDYNNTNDDERENLENNDQEIPKRSEMDAAHGDDMIEIEKNEGRRISDMDKFTPLDGDVGDESMDLGDATTQTRKNHNYYDPAASTGGTKQNFENPEGMHISKAANAGLGYGDDGYVDDDGNPQKSKEKQGKNEEEE